MNLNIYSVYDRAVGTYGSPFAALAHGQAIRNFADLTNDQRSTISKHPGDFTLFHIGTFNDQLGQLVECKPEKMADAINLVQKPDPRQLQLLDGTGPN